MLDDYEDYMGLRLFRLAVRPFEGSDPNRLSLLSLGFALLTGLAVALGQPLAAALAMALCMFFDGIDGYVARLQGRQSELGFLVDHVLDRLADMAIFVGIGAAAGQWLPALSALAIAIFSSYVGVLNRIYGLRQDKAGLFNRTHRSYLLILALLAMAGLPGQAHRILLGYLLLAVLSGALTSAARLRRLFAAVAALERGDGP